MTPARPNDSLPKSTGAAGARSALRLLSFPLLLAASAFSVVPWAAAQTIAADAAAQGGAPARPGLRAGRIEGPIHLDGRLDEPAWTEADSIPHLTEIEPTEGGRPSARTVVRVLADEHQLIFGIVAYDPDPSGIVAHSVRRDASLRGEDNMTVVLDPFLDGRSGVVFRLNPNGARYDALVSRRGEGENADWDAVWDARAVRTASGWSAEIWIPVRSLTFDSGLRRWGLNIQRRIERLQETDRWASPVLDYSVTQTSRAGLLTGLPEFSVGLGLSVRPYVTAGGGIPAPDSDLETQEDQGIDIGQRIGTNLEATITVNTDFAETEVDARQTNLTRFPLFFPEKRAFFLQGSDIFDFSLGLGDNLIPFFSRRIGLVEGRTVPIDIGAKLAGRAGDTNLGALAVRMGDVRGLAPANTMGVVRVEQNVLSESSAGFLATFGDPLGRGGSWLAGPDVTYQTSHFRGDKNFLVGVWALAMDREGLTGVRSAWGLKVDYPNELWDVSLTHRHIGTDFDPSLGFVPRPGTNQVNLGVDYRPRPAWSLVRQMFFQLEGSLFTRLDGSLQS
ncbi:MAG TPA: DUF5916 domain-containing protein, partial [Actinomycetota bacterium]|nr:DUF5916 domain-containing protein [Actinomycetota bacterium]